MAHGEKAVKRTAVDGDAAVQEQETADQREAVGGDGRALLQTTELMEVPGNTAAVHLCTGNHICHHGDQSVRSTLDLDLDLSHLINRKSGSP